MTELLSKEKIPSNWLLQEGSDYHVSIFKDQTPNSLIFAPKYNTLELLDDCVYSATEAGKKLITTKICNAFEVKYMYESKTGIWTHIRLSWEDQNE